MRRSIFIILGTVLAGYCFGAKAISVSPQSTIKLVDNPQTQSIYSATKNVQWVTYYNGSIGWIWNLADTVEMLTHIIPSDFAGVQYPCYIKRLKHLFYEHPSYLWASDEFKFRVYADDTTAVLHTSLVINALKHPSWTEYTLADSIQITAGGFWVSIYQPKFAAYAMISDDEFTGHSYVRTVSGGWDSLWWHPDSSGEASTGVQLSWTPVAHDVGPISYTSPSYGVKVGTAYPVSFTVENKGTNVESFGAGCAILTDGLAIEYKDSTAVLGLAAGATKVINLSNWTPALYGESYTVVFRTVLSGDLVPQNDTLIRHAVTYEEGELAYDDFVPESHWIVGSGPDGTNGPDDAFGVHFTTSTTLPFHVVKGKVYVNGSTPFEYIGLFPGTESAPNISSHYDTVAGPSQPTPPGWICVSFDTSKTRITTSDPLWLVAKFAEGQTGPGIGGDETPDVEANSCWTSDMSAWNPITDCDFMMRIVLDKPVGIEETPVARGFSLAKFVNPVRDHFSVEYTVPVKTNVNISLYDITGSLVQALENGVLGAGNYKKEVNTANLRTGIYFLKAHAGKSTTTQKLILLK